MVRPPASALRIFLRRAAYEADRPQQASPILRFHKKYNATNPDFSRFVAYQLSSYLFDFYPCKTRAAFTFPIYWL